MPLCFSRASAASKRSATPLTKPKTVAQTLKPLCSKSSNLKFKFLCRTSDSPSGRMQPNLITWTDQPFPFYTLITYSISESLGVCKMLMFSKIHAASFKQHVFVSCINHRFEIPTRVSSGIISIPSLHNKARHHDQHPKSPVKPESPSRDLL